MTKFNTVALSSDQLKRVSNHLKFIDYLTRESIRYGYRTVIGGGYAVDGIIGQITRPHTDIDIHLYGTDVLNTVLLSEVCQNVSHTSYSIEDKGRSDYWHSFFITEVGAKIYYIRVAFNPFSESKIVIKSDNTYAEEQDFETTVIVFEGVRFEVQNAVQELADKIYKRDYRGDAKLPKHDQDIQNLKLITDPYEVDFAIKQKIKLASHSTI